MRRPVAIVGMACRYPDADDPAQLLENSLAQRRSFRAIPPGRLSPTGYIDETGASPDHTYARQAAVLKGFTFDRARFRVSRSSYDVTDLTHWLALTVASEAVEDIRFRERAAHPHRDAVRVVVGNTLAGEFSRAGVLRLRWPYVRRVLEEQLRDDGRGSLGEAEVARLLEDLEQRYKAPFPVPDEDFLAGGLANTIGGRICNHFDFRGGCYTIDGACSSSLLAVTDACTTLAAGDADLVLAGGVDLSLDPFELVGFARSAALATDEMLVYDERSRGFWPGEGCGFVALMRLDDALADCQRIYGVIRGWGISSDGRGGLTRPTVEGQMLALRRCYQDAGFGIGTIGYVEGHGTGTPVGDATELQALIGARTADTGPLQPAVISSVKANIGHTKAAAGLAGLLRATMCLADGVLPPTTACRHPHPLLADNEVLLSAGDEARPWPAPAATTRRVGVSASGFGGINTHVTIEEAPRTARPRTVAVGPDGLDRIRRTQDVELFLFAAGRRADLAWTVQHVARIAEQCSRAELTDLAVELARRATRGALAPWKAAVVAGAPAELQARAHRLRAAVESHPDRGVTLGTADGVSLSSGDVQGSIGLVFSGQGSPARITGGPHTRRFDGLRTCYDTAQLDAFVPAHGTEFAQSAITTASLAGLALLRRIGAAAEVAVGHSLGELTALHWAGYYDASALAEIVRARAAAMAADPDTVGAMAAVAATPAATAAAIDGRPGLHIANLNAARQTIVSGGRDDIEELVTRLHGAGTGATVLAVGHAFHTPMMAGAARTFARRIAGLEWRRGDRPVVSTVTGARLPVDTDIVSHLRRQPVAPVRFQEAASTAAAMVDLLVEVGPGQVLTRLLRGYAGVPVVGLDIGGESLAPCLHAAGAAYVLGRAPAIGRLFDDRAARRFDWSWKPSFLSSPCEREHTRDAADTVRVAAAAGASPQAARQGRAGNGDGEPDGTRERLRALIAEHTGLPAWTIEDGSRMLSELHLNSITVGEIVTRLAAALAVPFPPVDPTQYADASLADIAAAVDGLAAAPGHSGAASPRAPAGVDDWVRAFAPFLMPAQTPAPAAGLALGRWEGFGTADHEAQRLLARLNDRPHGSGVLVWLSGHPQPAVVDALVAGAQRCAVRARAARDRALLVVVQPGWGGGGFARSWFLEERIDTLVVNLPAVAVPGVVPVIADEIAGRHPDGHPGAPAAFDEVFLDRDGHRTRQRLQLVTLPAAAPPRIGAGDAVLVTGGGKGISAECAHQLALHTGCALLILGRSAPATSPELAANLARLQHAGVRVSYRTADVTDAGAVRAAVAAGVTELGLPVRGVVHGAGLNEPRTVARLSTTDVRSTLATKLGGLRHVLAAVDAAGLRLLVTFGSIIARIGLHGEADYALANEWLRHETETFQAAHPDCRCACLEWSVWSGTGMGQRLGRIDALVGQGISPISIDAGIRAFQSLVDAAARPVSVVVTGRFGAPPTIDTARAAPGPFRFAQSVPVYYPGVELVADCELSPRTDPYLDDHVLEAERLLPAVMALEAMTEVATLVTGADPRAMPSFRDVRFRAALVVGGGVQPLTVRVAALVEPDGEVRLTIRSSSTGFRINHVEARCVLRPPGMPPLPEDPAAVPIAVPEAAPADAARALYRSVLFQTGRFQRVAGYWMTEARRCAGRLSADGAARWFSDDFARAVLLLGDPGARDAALHAIQACIPHKLVIPTAVGRIDAGALASTEPYAMRAEERADHGHELVYDLTICDRAGRAVERWSAVALRVLSAPPRFRLDTPALLGPYVERQVAAAAPAARLRICMTALAADDQRRRAPAGSGHRPDGRPDAGADGRPRSVAYDGVWRLDASAAVPVGCDLESVVTRPRDRWRALLGDEGLQLAEVMAEVVDEALDIAATRVWTVREALKKAGLPVTVPLVVDPDSTTWWSVLHAGAAPVFSTLIAAHGTTPARCVAVALVLSPAGG